MAFTIADTFAERIGNEYSQATTLHQLDRIAEERGNTAKAMVFHTQTEEILMRVNDPYSLNIVQESLQRVRKEPGSLPTKKQKAKIKKQK